MRTLTSSRPLNIALLVIGGIFTIAGAISAGYGIWAWKASQAYLAEITASGQIIEALDGASFTMSNGGTYLLIGILLLGHGGIYFLARHVLGRIVSPIEKAPIREQEALQRPTQAVDEDDDELDTFLAEIADDVQANN